MTSTGEDPFADIRPYTDSEVPAVIARLVREPALADALARLRLGWLYGLWPGAARRLVSWWVQRLLRKVHTVEDVQMRVKVQLEAMLRDTTVFSSSGLEALDKQASWLFISNHRDITMDPALTNYAIHQAGHRTLAIAIGDNLLKRSWVADLMRLNKSFIVKRNISAPRELMAASRQLSGFIRWMITENRGPVWIAQREGRAKDGIDATEPAVIKMLGLSRDRKTESVADVLGSLHIVPVAIAYEIDPCDGMKAAELAAGPGYTKSDDEDVRSIGAGISGQKGRVHLSFGSPIDVTGDVAQVVEAIDAQIRTNYRLFETNLWAWQRLEQTDEQPAVEIYPGTLSRAEFFARIDALPEAHQPFALAMYANPLRAAIGSLEGVA